MNLFVRRANGRYGVADANQISQAATELLKRPLRREPALGSPEHAEAFLNTRLRLLEHELFCMMVLDNRNRLIDFVELFRGTIDGASVHPREVVKEILKLNGAAVIFAHNHPSGVAEPSQADEVITRRLKAALALIDVRVLDHLVVGETTVSFAERGLL